MFFKFLIFILVIVLIMRWLGFSMRIISNYRKQRRQDPSRQKRREGEVRITYNPQKEKKITTEEGEYVEYEETKD